MAAQFSFDIVSEVDLQELDNAINQALKEILQRYDFKGSKSEITFNKKEKVLNIISDDDYKLKAVVDILQNKMIKRGISIKALKYGNVEPAGGNTVRQEIKLQQGIEKDDAKLIVKLIKDAKLKVQATIQDEQVRVSGKVKDDLQEVMNLLKEKELDFALQFTNYR
ncbi:MAG TPA: YajQ family cyclic di-GMP-binding protein [Ignavibacteria bacterium]|nr:YajQ family cyclic di-GMP-binding protein [Ignavibacteria bacterium]HQY51993.1 YajQ family cyclic di-GMP-binding protein [Ignavibacteria bacterium]HRB00507.1 YajQ family cyclic di-GMP-binding protein [Ignavibacteria bacterium]